MSLDAELRDRLSLPEPYGRAHARYFGDDVALRAAREGHGADFAIEDSETATGLGWVGFYAGTTATSPAATDRPPTPGAAAS